MVSINPEIAKILKSSKDSIINDPIEINNEWYLIQRENLISAIYSEYYENQICNVDLQSLANKFCLLPMKTTTSFPFAISSVKSAPSEEESITTGMLI